MAKKSKAIAQELGLGRPKRRPIRVAQAIQEELATLFLRGIKDPRVAVITITKVEVSPDLRQAVIFYDTAREEASEAAAGLSSAKGFIRSHLAGALNLRLTPELVFKRDVGALNQARIEELLREDEERDEPAAE
ncbi:MAG: 30S ribosome-binding factor RbfA [Desulfobacteraceae bacterium]|nr:30S ribosome-binding factor RbfA [Desulfobacteraceae bacterium]